MQRWKKGQRESRSIENNVIAIRFGLLDDLLKIASREELKSLYGKVLPDASENRKNYHVGQVYAFVTKVRIGDLVVVPMKTSETIWIGRIQSNYKFRDDFEAI